MPSSPPRGNGTRRARTATATGRNLEVGPDTPGRPHWREAAGPPTRRVEDHALHLHARVMSRPARLFSASKPVIAMIHVGALPGTPAHREPLRVLEARAVQEAKLYRAAGVDGV